MILDDIVVRKLVDLEHSIRRVPIQYLAKRCVICTERDPVRDFAVALQAKSRHAESLSGISIIGEIKKASPSKGILKPDFDPASLAAAYHEAGADALSVLTEERFFLGSPDHLTAARKACPLPVLRKDFIIDIRQVYESRIIGADAILLIAAILDESALAEFICVARRLGMSALVETHNKAEIGMAIRCGARIIGVNNRDLNTFRTDITLTGKMMSYMPTGTVVVSESGISSGEDISFLIKLGVDAALIGELFMRAASIRDKVKELRNG